MILSASVNADVPARYGAWFQRRLEAGFLRVAGADPWKQRRIELAASNIDGIVFWTRDVTPFFSVLSDLRNRGLAFTLQYALTAEPSSAAAQAAIQAIQRLAYAYGPRAVVWRYDPVILDRTRTAAWHRKAFATIAGLLAGTVDEVVVAYARATASVPVAARRELLGLLAASAAECGMRLTLCADFEALVPGSSPARCIDARRLTTVAGREIESSAGGFMRDCLCARAIDIGDRGKTAPEQFCGAIPGRRRPLHNGNSEFLFEPVRVIKRARPNDLPF